jgi:hypothetical protein
MNRFSNYTPSAYSPMSMQEIMTVPLAMREQHNNVQKDIQAQQSELDKINALPVHTEEAKQRKNYLLSRIDALSSDLANKGFNNGMTDNVIKLNREVKNEFSPTGRLGQINNAHSTYFKALEDFKKSNDDKKWSQQEFDLNWNKHLNQYKGYDEKGEITTINSLSAPEKRTIQDEWEQISKITGNSKIATDILTGTSDIVPGPNGSVMTINKKTGDKISYNNPQIVAGLSSIYAKLNDPTSDLSIAREYAGRSLESDMFEAYNLGLSKIDTDIKTIRDIEKSLSGVKNSADLAAQQGSVTTIDTEEVPLHNQDSYGQSQLIRANIENKIKNNQPLTDDEKEQYVVAQGMKFNYDEVIKDINIGDKLTTSDGKKLSYHFGEQLGLFGKRVNFKYVEDLKTKKDQEFIKKYKGTPQEKLAKEIVTNYEKYKKAYSEAEFKGPLSLVGEYDNKTKKINTVYHNYKNAIFTKTNTYSNFYDVATSDSQSETGKRFGILSEKIVNSIKSPSAENSIGNISAVTDVDGNLVRLAGKKDVSKTRKNIINVMRESKDVKIVGYSDNDGGFPSIKFRVTPDKDNEVSETIYGSSDWNDGNIGNKSVGGTKEFDVVLRLGDFSNIQNSQNKFGTNNAATEILKTMYQTGDTKTKEFAKKAIERIQAMNKI